MLDVSRLVRIAKYLAPALLLIYFLSDLRETEVRDKYTEILRSFKDEKKLFVSDFLGNEVDGSFDGRELARLCAGRAWHPEDKALILTCSPMPGGVGEVKNGHLHCIRFAIEIGAQLVLPRITRRSTADISNLRGEQQAKGQPLDYMFSSKHLISSLQAYCPQMRVHQSLDDLYDKPSLLKPLPVSLRMLTDQVSILNDTRTTILAQPQNVTRLFDEFYERELPLEKRHYPVRVELQETIFVWPAHYDGEAFRRDFGRLLRVREDVKMLAASGLWNMARRFGLPLDPRKGIAHNPAQDRNPRFVGVHLRTEKDAAQPQPQPQEGNGGSYSLPQFPGYDVQAAYFLDYLSSAQVAQRVVYLATGLQAEDADVQRLTAKAAELGTTIVTKRDVLEPGEVAMLNNHLTWDQRALVDYEIMLRAGYLLGVVESSFAWNLAMRRGNAYGGGAYGVGAEYGGFLAVPNMEPGATGLIMWQDRYSKLFGTSDRAVNMFYGIWP